MNCNLFILGKPLFPCLGSGRAAPHGGGTTFGFGAQGRVPYLQKTGQQRAGEDNTRCCVHRMVRADGQIGEQMGDLQRAAARDVLRRPLHEGPEGRWKRGQVVQRVGALAVQRW